MAKHSGRRNADEQLLLGLACGATVEAAARQAGVSLSTAHRRLQDPDFRRRLDDLRADMLRRTAGMLAAAAGEAVKTLLALQKDTVQAAVRLGAARAILEVGLRVREAADFERRLGELERRAEGPA